MADPFAPPADTPRTPRSRRADLAPPPPAAPPPAPVTTYGGTATPPPANWSEPARPEPARPGVFWTVAAAGVGLLCLAHLLRFFVLVDDIPDEQVAPSLLGILGVIALAAGLALAALLQRGLTVPWRIALLLGAGYFATMASGWLNFLGVGVFG